MCSVKVCITFHPRIYTEGMFSLFSSSNQVSQSLNEIDLKQLLNHPQRSARSKYTLLVEKL